MEHPLAPKALGSPMHTHRREDEYSGVYEGRVDCPDWGTGGRGDSWLGAGQATSGAARVLDGSDQSARLLEAISPAGFARYFAERVRILSAHGAPARLALAAPTGRYDLELDLTSIPRLAAEHGFHADPR